MRRVYYIGLSDRVADAAPQLETAPVTVTVVRVSTLLAVT